MIIKANDIIKHIPTGEEWVVCGINHDKGELIPCGYPFPSIAKTSDCQLIEERHEPQTEEQKKALAKCGLLSFIEGGKAK